MYLDAKKNENTVGPQIIDILLLLIHARQSSIGPTTILLNPINEIIFFGKINENTMDPQIIRFHYNAINFFGPKMFVFVVKLAWCYSRTY